MKYFVTVVFFLLCTLQSAPTLLGAPMLPGVPTVGQVSSPTGEEVRGRVISVLDQHPLIGVNVVIAGTSRGVITDVDGSFVLEALPSDTLIFSYVGYETLSVPVGSRSFLEVSLAEDINMLTEIEVFSTGYQELPKERATGSFAGINNDLVNRAVSADVVSRLEGVTPALLVDSRNGEARLSIRGRSTIFGNSDPLIVVDNFPYDGNIDNINPNDIDRITVLKDAAAASIWGVRAGNGVIVITTKKGRQGKGMRLDFNANVTVGSTPDLFYAPQMSVDDFIGVERFLFDQGYYDNDLSNTLQYPAVSPVVELLSQARDGVITDSALDDALAMLGSYDVRDDVGDLFYRESVNQQYALSLSGGDDGHRWYVSGGYDKALSSRVGHVKDRLTLSTNHAVRLLRGLNLDLGLTYTQRHARNNNALMGLLSGEGVYPYARLVDEAGQALPVIRSYRQAFVDTVSYGGLLDWHHIPADELNAVDNTTMLNDVRALAGLSYELLEGLSFSVSYQYERQGSDSRVLYDESSWFVRDLLNRYASVSDGEVIFNIPKGSIFDASDGVLVSTNFRGQADYSLTVGPHALTALAGVDVREVTTEGYSHRYYGYDPGTGLSTGVNYQTYYQQYPSSSWALVPRNENVTGTVDRFRSFFANAAYTYDHRYTLSLSGRVDQSNLFGVSTNQRSVPLWSSGFKWSIVDESFYHVAWLPVLSLRTTFGYNGNLDNSVTALTTMRYASDALTGRQRGEIVSPPNDALRWETTALWNVGVDFAFVDDVVSGSVEYYRKAGTDLIGDSALDPTTGLSSFRGNVADMKGHGVDMMLQVVPFDRSFRWSSDFLFSYTTDEVTRYKEQPSTVNAYFRDASLTGYPFDLTPVEGKPLFGVYSYPWAGLDPSTGDPMGYVDGEISVDHSEIISSATFDGLVYHGPALPPFFGSWMNTVTWKGLSLSVNITYKLGHYFRRPSVDYSSLFSTYYGHSDYALRWQSPGDEAHTEVPSMVYPASSSRDTFYENASVLVEPADHIRLQDIRLSYDLSREWGSLQVYGYVRNLGLLWRANGQGIDPDYNINRSVQTGSIVYPEPLSFSVGVKAGF